ncbi:MAG: Lon-like protease with PDZ domain, partial [uncultured Quadrisphaera sp.]
DSGSPAARSAAAWVGAVGAALLAAALTLLPVPFVVEQPGPVYDTLGEVDGTPLITVEGAPTYPTTGSLDLTTVRVSGGPGGSVDLLAVLVAWLHPDRSALLAEQVYPPGTSAEEERRRDTRDMTASQDSATVAALTELGYRVPTTLTVVGAAPGSPADGLLLEGDVVQAVDGAPAPDLTALRAALDVVGAGRSVTVTVLRDAEPVEVPVRTALGDEGQVQLGISVDVDYADDDLPVQVAIEVDRVGGPSAGLLFALGIVDLLTEGPMTGGLEVAGTGTIATTGEVGGIGGVAQKMAAADDAGADLFLAPEANCDEVVGHVPEGLRVVSVATLAEARDAVEAAGRGEAEGLPECRP